jgi:FAD/FMN-containing dehydrogenase/Fe-S oxidoreductase
VDRHASLAMTNLSRHCEEDEVRRGNPFKKDIRAIKKDAKNNKMKLNQLFLSELQNSGFSGDFTTEKSVAVIYSTDNSIYEIEPDGVIFPRNQNDVSLIFKLLRQKKFHQIKITARGGGTSTNGQSINKGFIVDYSRYMNRILKIDVESKTAEVEPGVILDVLNFELEKFNLYFPPNISPSNRATIGGMVNTDACGKGSCTHGRTSDNILDLSLHLIEEENVVSSKVGTKNLNSKLSTILAKARNLYSSKHLSRTTTGYNIEKSFADEKLDLNYLISGSEGTLALVSKITVKLKKLPKKKRVVLLRYKNFDAALQDAQNVIALNPTAIETIDENVIRLARNDIIWQDVGHLVGDGHDTSINILEFSYESEEEFESHEEEIRVILNSPSVILNSSSVILNSPSVILNSPSVILSEAKDLIKNTQIISDKMLRCSQHDKLKTQHNDKNFLFENFFIINNKNEIANIWNLRKQGVGLLGAMKGKRRPLPFVEDTIVPPQELADYISGFREILKKYEVVYGMFGHVDAGCLHVRPALNMRQEKDRELIRKISDEVCDLLLKHRGVIWGEHGKGFRSEYNEKFLGAEVQKIFSEIKKTFDPFEQLNCGKIAGLNQAIPALDEVSMRGEFDENIAPQIHDEFENILSCNGNALCFNLDKASAMCPSYKASMDRRFSPKGRAMLFKEWVRENSNLPSIRKNISFGFFKNFTLKISNLFSKNFDSEIYQSFSKCLGCKACNTQCPIKVSIPDAKAYFLSLYFTKNFRKAQDYLIGNIEKLLLICGKFPRTFNFLTQNKITKFLVRKIFAVTDILPICPPETSICPPKKQPCPPETSPCHPEQSEGSHEIILQDVSLTLNMTKKPPYPPKKSTCTPEKPPCHPKTSTCHPEQSEGSHNNKEKIYILRDAYTNYFHGKDLENAYKILTKLGFNVEFTKVFENGKALHAKGFLNSFRKVIAKNISYLSSLNATLISIDPSVTLSYRDEYPRFCDQKIEVIYLAEFLQKVAAQKSIISDKKYHLILHCSEQTNFGKITEIWSEIFTKFNIKLNIIKTGCCGMSGSFGMETQNFDDSKIIFENNWQQLLTNLSQDQNNIIMASGSSCKSQVERFSKIKISNPFFELNQIL